MLPILRLIPVGGVILAIVILVLALDSPGGSHPPVSRGLVSARGALIAITDNPEQPQLLLKAALRRADELNQLRQLSEESIARETAPAGQQPEKPQEVAAVPEKPGDTEPDGATGSVAQSQEAAIPLDIGEASSTELPVSKEPEHPPVAKSPQRETPTKESHNVAPPQPPKAKVTVVLPPEPPPRKPVRRARRAKVAAPAPDPAQFNLLAAFFASFSVEQPTAPRRR